MTESDAWTSDLSEVLSRPPEAATCLPAWAFRDAGYYEWERAQTFGRGWVCVGPSEAVASPGSYVTTDVAGEPVLVLRNTDGELRALSNVCRHRGNLLVDGRGASLDTIRCGYHAWTYRTDGSLIGVPHDKHKRVEKAKHCLPHFRLGQWRGLLFVNLDEHAPPLEHQLTGLDAYLPRAVPMRAAEDPHGASGEAWRANWKLALENGLESYHLFCVHAETLEPITPTKGAYYVAGGPRWSVTGGSSTRGDDYRLVFIPPGFIGVLEGDSMDWLAVNPTGPEACVVRGGSLHAETADGGWWSSWKSYSEAANYEKLATAFLAEDKAIVERVQRGMQTRISGGGRLVDMERIVGDFHTYLGEALGVC